MLIDCMFLSLFLEVIRMFLSIVSFFTQLDSRIISLWNALLLPMT